MPARQNATNKNAINGITVAHFFESYGKKLKMELVTREAGLQHIIREGSINRPSLALTGFFKYFANKRIQVLGAAEMTYLRTLPPERQTEIFRGMVEKQIPCLVITRNLIPGPELIAVAREADLPVFRTPLITMKFINQATHFIDNEFTPAVTQHATTVDIRGIGVMIRGGSGVGKSECALALIERGHSLVADDVTVLKLLDERELTASSRPLSRGYLECRGIGILNIVQMFGVRSVRPEKRVDLVISMYEWTPDAVEERTGIEDNYYEILGQKIPHITLYVRPGRDMARLIEVAALSQALKHVGINMAKEFDDRLIEYMQDPSRKLPTAFQVKLRTRSPADFPPILTADR